MAKKGIPFDGHSGDMYIDHYSVPITSSANVVWVENKPFRDRMTFEKRVYMAKVRFQFRSHQSGARVFMKVDDLCDALPYMHAGVLDGVFGYDNTGGNYGIKFLPNGVVR